VTGLVIDQLSVARGGHTVVREVSINAPLGEVTAILGPNGAGKSSLALGIAGLLRTTGGTVSIDGVDITHRRPDKVRAAGVSVVPEGRKLLPELSVADNLQVSTYSLSKGDSTGGIDYAMSLFPELETRYDQLGSTLSGGQQQMLVLAQGLVSHPKVLLVDELSLGLAPIVIKRLVPTIESIAAAGVGVLLIEQFAHVALGLATTAYVMESARVRYSGTAQELIDNPDLLHSAYLLRE
jgi:branched-chain amino acid transport system ATP-binding protein